MYAKKNNGKKILVTLLAVILLIGATVGGTLAWLSATSESVTNTFTVGDINITLQEYPFAEDEDGNEDPTKLDETVANAVQAIDTYKVVPGGEQPKKPFVIVKEKSENCYVYVSIENNLVIDGEIAVTYDVPVGWTKVATQTAQNGVVTELYRYNDMMPYSTTDSEPLEVFTKVNYSDEIVKDTIKQLEGKTIVLNAFAHQADNIEEIADADDAAIAHFKITPDAPATPENP